MATKSNERRPILGALLLAFGIGALAAGAYFAAPGLIASWNDPEAHVGWFPVLLLPASIMSAFRSFIAFTVFVVAVAPGAWLVKSGWDLMRGA